nr:VWA domain-containing protein [Planctomycetales bacterium]
MPAWLTTLFGSPWMLAWLPAAAVPILIHLWNRRKYREVPWAAMQYLLAAISKSTRRMRIEQLLLLAVRTLLILLAVLALAEPFLSAVASPLARRARTHRLLVLDASYSMACRFGDQSAFAMAQEAAIQIVEDGNEGDAYSLILMADRPQVVVGTAAYDRAEFIREIQNLQLPHGGANLPAALQAAQQIVQQVRQDQKQLQRHHIYFLTDLGRNTWSDGQRGQAEEKQSKAEKKEFAGLLDQLADPQHGFLEVLPVGTAVTDNVAITQLTAVPAHATIGRPVRLQASFRSFRRDTSRQVVELWIDGRRVDQQTVDILPGEKTPPVVFDYQFVSPGDHALEVRIDGDPLQTDNSRFLVLPVKEHLEALLVSGRRGSTLPLEAALDGGDFQRGLQSTIRPQVVAESALLEEDLNRYDCIFLCNVGQFTADEALVLSRYLQEGGGLVTILGDQVQAERYNRELTGIDGGSRVLPARLGEAFSDGSYHYFDPRGYQHPLMARWRGKPKSGLTHVPVLKFYRLQVPESAEAGV